MTADPFVRDASVVHQSLEDKVIVLAETVACANTILKENYLVRVIAKTKIPHPHLLPLQVAVTTVLGLFAVPS